MTGRDDARYRLELGRRSLELARDEAGAGRWRETALFARAAIEHATKAAAACFGPVPRTHEPGVVLDGCTTDARFPRALLPVATALRPRLEGWGADQHILLSYGDEKARIDPWTLVTEDHARKALSVAGEAVALAEACIDGVFA